MVLFAIMYWQVEIFPCFFQSSKMNEELKINYRYMFEK
jgi:hypothetical protein